MDIGKLLGDVLGSGGATGTGGAGSTGSTGGIGDTVSKAMNSGIGGGLIGGAISGGLMSTLLGSKKGRKVGGKVLAYGGTAVVAGLAYKAWRDYRNNKPPADHSHDRDIMQVPADSGFAPEHERDATQTDFRLSLIRAMISAAKSDGHIDQTEHARITDQIADFGLGNDEKAFLFDAFSAPADPITIAKLANTEEQSAELYLASCLAIDPDNPDEQRYLDRLSDGLRMPAELRNHLDHQAASARKAGQA
jgi:uncharacterized membrane protein YebE (DUF533 family)